MRAQVGSTIFSKLVRVDTLLFGSALLILRFMFGWLPSRTPWVDSLFQIGTYAIIAIWIVRKRNDLAQYHIDSLALWFFILFKPLQTLILPFLIAPQTSFMAVPQLGAVICWIIAGILLFILRKELLPFPKISKIHVIGMIAGAVTGVILVILLGIALIPWTSHRTAPQLDLSVLFSYPYMLGYVGIDEEFVFRGLLWGLLRRVGWRDVWIWLTQAASFALVHGYVWSIEPAWPFVGSILVGGLVFGALAWRSRSVIPAMLAHAFYNSSWFLSVIVINALK